jgi:hypothetical protein
MFPIKLAGLAVRRALVSGGVTCLLLILAGSAVAAQTSEQLFTVLNPTGIAPEIERKSMAARTGSLDGKTVYLVDVTFNGGDIFLEQMQEWMAANMPEVKTEFRIKQGIYSANDPALWEEIQSVDGAMIMAIGH